MRALLVDLPAGADVVAYLGSGDPAQAGTHVGHMTAIVRAYTRGRGFFEGDPPQVAADLAAVIVTATARLVINPGNMREVTATGVGSQTFNEFRGFNLAEQMVLNSHRRRAA